MNNPSQSLQPSKILFLVDTTNSMTNYVSSLKHSIMQLFSLLNLLDLDVMVAIMAYKDQSDMNPITWSKWVKLDDPAVYRFIDSIRVGGGSPDFAETSKLALTLAAMECSSSTNALVIHYSDAPPHCDSFYFSQYTDGTNRRLERDCLVRIKKPTDWMDICSSVRSSVRVVTLCSKNISYSEVDVEKIMAYYALLGDVIYVEKPNTYNITKTTIDMIISHFNFKQKIDSYYCYKLNTDKIFTNEHEFGLENAFGNLLIVPYIHGSGSSGSGSSGSGSGSGDAEHTQTLELVNKFKENMGGLNLYRDKVYTIMKSLIETEEGLYSLTHNTIFATLWRAITAFKRYDNRTHDIMRIMQLTMTKLVGYRLEVFKEWLEESYNRCAEIIDTINNTNLNTESRVFIIQTNDSMTNKSFMEAFRGNAVLSSVGKVINFISMISVCKYGELTDGWKKSYKYIPVNLSRMSRTLDMPSMPGIPSINVMNIISHLIAPGIILSERPTAVLCMLVCVSLSSDNELYKHASSYLKSIKGKWLDIDVPEISDNYASNFLNIMRQFTKHTNSANATNTSLYMTPEEVVFFDRLFMLTNVTQNLNKYINIEVPYRAKGKFLQMYDHHVNCASCGKLRSFTLMYTKDQCGLCLLINNQTVECIRSIIQRVQSYNCTVEQTIAKLIDTPSQDNCKSNLFECTKCNAYYSVIDIDSLRIRPMCHFCRIGSTPKTSVCTGCDNKFVDNASLLNGLNGFNGLCGNCSHGIKHDEIAVTIGEVLTVNPGFLELFGISSSSVSYLNSGFTIHKACTKDPPLVVFMDDTNNQLCTINNMPKHSKYKSYENVAKLLLTEVSSGSCTEECGLCLDVLPYNKLVRSCGNCTKQICITCAKKWYSQNSPGNIVLQTYSMCPFCKCVPTYKTIRAYNRLLCIHNNRKHKYDNTAYEAWCRKCGSIKVHVSKECANDIPQLNGMFECTVCVNTLDQTELIKACPGCKTMCYRDGGCDHIECPIKECGLHWCWVCKKSSKRSRDIYRHMEKKHGYQHNYYGSDSDSDSDGLVSSESESESESELELESEWESEWESD